MSDGMDAERVVELEAEVKRLEGILNRPLYREFRAPGFAGTRSVIETSGDDT